MPKRILTTLIFSAITNGCATKEFDPKDPAKSFMIAKEPYEDENYDIAVNRLGEYKSRFPYSQYAVEAELLIANAHFELDQFAEAAAAYGQFVKLHPTHNRSDFAQYRIAESYWQDSPEAVDREQEFTEKAVSEWQTLVATKPESSYAAKAKPMITQGYKRMAEAHEFAAKYYCKQELWHACAYRFTLVAEQFPQFPEMRRNALKTAAGALRKLATDLPAKMAEEKKKTDDSNLYYRDFSAQQLLEKARALESAN